MKERELIQFAKKMYTKSGILEDKEITLGQAKELLKISAAILLAAVSKSAVNGEKNSQGYGSVNFSNYGKIILGHRKSRNIKVGGKTRLSKESLYLKMCMNSAGKEKLNRVLIMLKKLKVISK